MERQPGSSSAFALGAGLAGLGVILGAFGAHALAALPPGNLAWWHTGTQYLFIAAFGILFDGLFERTTPVLRRPAIALALGALMFSGSLFAMALGAPRWLGMITPLGGLSLIAGFAWLGVRGLRARS
jgi:uncharacterized membrane protein YgdD (TMEM256/DUF423 family)